MIRLARCLLDLKMCSRRARKSNRGETQWENCHCGGHLGTSNGWREAGSRVSPASLRSSRKPRKEFAPAIESYIKDSNLVVRADVPGLEPKDIEINVLQDILTIKGERKSEKEIKQIGRASCRERV